MNFTSKNSELRKEVEGLIGEKLSNDGIVNFSVSYSQNHKLSLVVIELSRTAVLHSLIFIYTRGLTLYDVQRYKNKMFHRINFNGHDMKKISFINDFILRNINRSNPVPDRKLKEVVVDNMKDDVKDFQIKRLRDQMKILRDQIQSLRNQLKFVKSNYSSK